MPASTLDGRPVERRARVGELYLEGLTTREIAAELVCSQSLVAKYIKQLGISRPAGRRAKYAPPPTDRRCETCNAPIVFRFPSDAVDHGDYRQGRYCSPECRHEAIAKYPKPEPRACAGCGKTFTPLRAHGDAQHCSVECTRTGQLVACAHCGNETYFPGWAIRRGYHFCSRRCWGKHRWRDGLALAALIAKKKGNARRIWKLRWAPKPGRPRGYTDQQATWVRALAAQGYGHEKIAQTTGLNRDTVRRIRGRQKRS